MARIRTIKPEFWTSEQVVECSPNARLLFIGMLNFCDDSGIHPANARRVQMEVFPCGTFSKDDVAAMIEELIENELLEEYEANGEVYWRATGFTKHQKVDQPTYRHPLPSGEIPQTKRRNQKKPCTTASPQPEARSPNNEQDSANVPRTLSEHSKSVHPRKGREGKGKENSNSPHTPRDRGALNAEQQQRFNRFWEAYPLKKSKGQAEKAFARLAPDDLLLEKMLAALRNQAEHREQLMAAGQFTPEHKHPSTWINAKAWEDELVPVQPQPMPGVQGGKSTAGPKERRAVREVISASVMDLQDTSW